MTNKRAKIDKLKAENASVERDVTRFNEREVLRATAAEMKRKVPWLVFGQAKTRWADAKTKLAALKKNIIAEEAKLKHLKTPMVKAKDELDLAVAKHKKCAAARKATTSKQRDLIETMETQGIEYLAILERLSTAKEESQNRERRIREREKKLRDAESARARGPSVPESNDDEIKELRAKRVTMNSELRAVEEEHEELRGRCSSRSTRWSTRRGAWRCSTPCAGSAWRRRARFPSGSAWRSLTSTCARTPTTS